jgi:hypothetical protein
MIVIYENPVMKSRAVTFFDGYANVNQCEYGNIPISCIQPQDLKCKHETWSHGMKEILAYPEIIWLPKNLIHLQLHIRLATLY